MTDTLYQTVVRANRSRRPNHCMRVISRPLGTCRCDLCSEVRAERDTFIYECAMAGFTFELLGRIFSLSRESVSQILRNERVKRGDYNLRPIGLDHLT